MTATGPGESWADHPEVREAFEAWRHVQKEIVALQEGATRGSLADLDEKLRAAQSRALRAWQLYEINRENAGGPLAGQP